MDFVDIERLALAFSIYMKAHPSAALVAVRDTRYAHFDIATKWLFVETRGIQPQMRFQQLEKFLRDDRSFDSNDPVSKRIRAALKFLHRAFPERCEVLRNRASVLSVCMPRY